MVFVDFWLIRHSDGLFDICPPYEYGVFLLIRHSSGYSGISSPYITLIYGELNTGTRFRVPKRPGWREIHGEQIQELVFVCLNGPDGEKFMENKTRNSFSCA